MVERQDIDALLISALYGELTPSEETRLAAHLEDVRVALGNVPILISIQSEPGLGSIFRIQIPISKEELSLPS